MCKINGHSIFTYVSHIGNVSEVYNSKKNSKKIEEAEEAAEEKVDEALTEEGGDETSTTVSTAKINKSKHQTLSSLRVPLEEDDVGTSTSDTGIGLNLGG